MMSDRASSRRLVRLVVLVALVALAAPAVAEDGPFGPWAGFTGNAVSGAPGHEYAEIAHDPALNPTAAITLEMWVRLQTPLSGCRSLIGKDFTQAYWVGVCGSTLRSYLRGGGSSNDGGTIPDDTWVHLAVTSDGVTKRHFINGVQVASFAAGGPNTSSPDPVRIGSDVSWFYTPEGEIDEVRIWRIALTAAELQDVMERPLVAAHPGLVAVWAFDQNVLDLPGGHDVTDVGGSPVFVIATEPVGSWITVPEIDDFRFKARISGGTIGTEVGGCPSETVCIAGLIPSRTEVLARVIGPRPNGYMHAQLIKFTVSRVEVWIEQLSTGSLRYYELHSVPGETAVLPGFVDKTAFLP